VTAKTRRDGAVISQSDYIRHVKNFTIFLGRSPDQARFEDLRLYEVHQRQQGVQPPTMNGAVAALRFFFTTTCNRPEMARHLTLVRQPRCSVGSSLHQLAQPHGRRTAAGAVTGEPVAIDYLSGKPRAREHQP
jgi:hypothetical protein